MDEEKNLIYPIPKSNPTYISYLLPSFMRNTVGPKVPYASILDEIIAEEESADREKEIYDSEVTAAINSDNVETDYVYKPVFGNNYSNQLGNNRSKAGMLKPALGVATTAMNIRKLKQTLDEALRISAPRVDAATVGYRPIQDIDPNVLALSKKHIGSLSTRKTSDAVGNIIAEQMLNQNKLAAMDAISTKQVENLLSERTRVDKVKADNDKANVKAMNEQAKLSTAVSNKKSGLRAEYRKAEQNMYNRLGDEVMKGINDRITYNLTAKMQNNANKASALQNLLNIAAYESQNAQTVVDKNTANGLIAGYRGELEHLYKTQGGMPYYGKASEMVFAPKDTFIPYKQSYK